MYHLSFGMYFLYTWSTREWCNLFGRIPNCRDSMINHIFRNTFPMRGQGKDVGLLQGLALLLSQGHHHLPVLPQLLFFQGVAQRVRLQLLSFLPSLVETEMCILVTVLSIIAFQVIALRGRRGKLKLGGMKP